MMGGESLEHIRRAQQHNKPPPKKLYTTTNIKNRQKKNTRDLERKNVLRQLHFQSFHALLSEHIMVMGWPEWEPFPHRDTPCTATNGPPEPT